jgi:beta-lactamase superfamily II metal-dependent hydrolase
VLSPPHSQSWQNDNDHSLMALLEAPRAASPSPARMLLTGDVGADALARVERATLPLVDAIELPHHGSPEPAAMRLVERVSPRVVLQSTGPSRVNDPRWDPARAAIPGAAWRITARDGWTSVTWLHDGSMTLRSMRSESRPAK